jgi:hypothetical protein
VEYGIDSSDPFGVGALFLGQSLANKFECHDQVHRLYSRMLEIDTPRFPNEPIESVLTPIDRLLDEVEPEPGMIELVEALVRLGAHSPPRTAQAQRLYCTALWMTMRYDPVRATPEVLEIMRDATPGARPRPSDWPGHEFFSAVLVLVYLGGPGARRELTDLLQAAQDLGYHDLAPILEWYLDHPHSAPAR